MKLTHIVSMLVCCFFMAATIEAAPTRKKSAPKKSNLSAEAKVYNQGIDYMAKKRWSTAQQYFQKAIQLNPNFAEAESNLGYVLRKQGPKNYKASLSHYNKAIKLNPKLKEAYHYRGTLFVLAGKKEAAIKDYNKLMSLDKKLAADLKKVIISGKESKSTAGQRRGYRKR